MSLILRNGLVIGPGEATTADVLVDDGRIAAIAPALDGVPGAQEIDCSGMWVGPGLVDMHTHLREPGGEHKETIATGSAAAAAGGYTAVVAMPNTTPAIDTPELVAFVANKGAEVGLVDVHPSAALSIGRRGARPAPYKELYAAGVRIFTDDGDTLADPELMRNALGVIGGLGGVVTQHAIDPELGAGGHLHDGPVAQELGVAGVPSDAEAAVVARDVDLVAETGAAYHVQHVSAAATVGVLVAAKERGLPVTAEVTPHHLAFHDGFLEDADPNFKMMPPLRGVADRGALRTAVSGGLIDVVATDHAPHAAGEKTGRLEDAAFGVTGLEHAAAVVNTVLGLPAKEFFLRCSVTPARIAKIDTHGLWPVAGAPANLVVFDPTADHVTGDHSASANHPYRVAAWRGAVRATILSGRVTFDGDQVVRQPGRG